MAWKESWKESWKCYWEIGMFSCMYNIACAIIQRWRRKRNERNRKRQEKIRREERKKREKERRKDFKRKVEKDEKRKDKNGKKKNGSINYSKPHFICNIFPLNFHHFFFIFKAIALALNQKIIGTYFILLTSITFNFSYC